MSTLPGKTVLVTGGLAANGYLTSVGPSGKRAELHLIQDSADLSK
jgi:hypothetical protein